MQGQAEMGGLTGPGASQTVELVQQLEPLPHTRVELRNSGQNFLADTPRLVEGTNAQRSVQQRAEKSHRQHESSSRCIFMCALSAIELPQAFSTAKAACVAGHTPSKGGTEELWTHKAYATTTPRRVAS